MFNLDELFGKSPFKPLYEHMQKVRDCVEKLPELKEAFLSADTEKQNEVFEHICKLEHKADIVKQNIRNDLPKRYFLPVDRADLLNFLNSQDSIADAVEDVAVIITIRNTRLPEKLKEEFGKLFDRVYSTCAAAFVVSDRIDELTEAGFGGYEAAKVTELIEKVGELEWRADKSQMNLSRSLFSVECDIDPVTVLVIDKIIVRLGKLANNAELTADMMRNLLSKK